MTYGDELSLKEAAKFAGVSEGTMRSWAKNVPGITRIPGGGYRIPREGLQGYIIAHKTGSKAIASSISKGRTGATSRGTIDGLIDEIKTENQRLRLELIERSTELREARSDLKQAQVEIRKLESELRSYLSGGISAALSRWIRR